MIRTPLSESEHGSGGSKMKIPEEYRGIIEAALLDYRRWCDGWDESDIAMRKRIYQAMEAIL